MENLAPKTSATTISTKEEAPKRRRTVNPGSKKVSMTQGELDALLAAKFAEGEVAGMKAALAAGATGKAAPAPKAAKENRKAAAKDKRKAGATARREAIAEQTGASLDDIKAAEAEAHQAAKAASEATGAKAFSPEAREAYKTAYDAVFVDLVGVPRYAAA